LYCLLSRFTEFHDYQDNQINSHSIREIIVASHVSEKKIFGQILFSLSKMAIGKDCGKGLDFKKE
jgi:hypothetical protein